MLFLLPHDSIMATAPPGIMSSFKARRKGWGIRLSPPRALCLYLGRMLSSEAFPLQAMKCQLRTWILEPDLLGSNPTSAVYKLFDFVHVT